MQYTYEYSQLSEEEIQEHMDRRAAKMREDAFRMARYKCRQTKEVPSYYDCKVKSHEACREMAAAGCDLSGIPSLYEFA
ncbi:MAG: hypothetical protein CMM93_08145 [Rickettsiales bacterium]|nr:hypothetical protein [Rickettsiales bacterium]